MVPVLQLLQRAHDASMVHRDLKPANIFIAIDGDKEVPKVLDFGVAKDVGGAATGVDLTSEQAIVGSPSYASPEQLTKSVAIDHRADIWSMGVVLFEMLTGSRPFSKEQVVPAIVEVCTAPIPTPTHVLPDLPPEVDRFFERALARDLARRFGSAREMAQALADLAGIVPASQRRVPAEVDPADERTVPETPADRSGDRAPSEGAPSMAHVASALARPRGPRRYGRALIPVAMIAALAVAIFALRILRAPSNVPSGMAVAITPVATLRDTSPLTPSDSSTELAQPTSGRSVAESASAVSSAPRGVAPANAGRARRSQSSHPAAALPVVPTSRSKPEQDVEVGY
jgi:serine/threonine-protein kinase